MDYSNYWNLQDKPFEELCNTRYFFESDDHREALDRMLYIVNDRNMNMGLLTGEVGSGKTITKNVFVSSLPRHDFEVVCFENSNFRFTDLLYDIVRRISFRDARIAMTDESSLPARDDKFLLIETLKSKLDTLVYEEKRHLVIILDEAQQIDDSTLDEIKNLTNISSETQNFLTVFFVGQPELRENIRRLKQVDQRVFLRFHLNNLDYRNAVNYIRHRLRVAGIKGEIPFQSDALELVFRATGGVPREINRVCKLALTHAVATGVKEIGRSDVTVILEDLDEHR